MRWESNDELINKIQSLESRIKELEKELNQQRFNNKHNLSIDQKISDKVSELEEMNESARNLISKINKKLINYAFIGAIEGYRTEMREFLKASKLKD